MTALPDVYESGARDLQLRYDAEDCRRSLYTNTKPDHAPDWRTGEPCNCEHGDSAWARNGVAMTVTWPPERINTR